MRHFRSLLQSLLVLAALGAGGAGAEETVSTDPAELSRRVEELKLESVNLARDVWLFEQSLGSDAGQVVVFLSADAALAGRLEQVELEIGDKAVTQHEYSASEAEALRKGGAHRLYAAGLQPGRHVLVARVRTRDGEATAPAKLSFRSGTEPKTIELRLQAAEGGAAELMVREWD